MHSKWGSRVCSSLPEDEEGVLTFPGLHPLQGKVKRGERQEGNRSVEDLEIFSIKISLFLRNTDEPKCIMMSSYARGTFSEEENYVHAFSADTRLTNSSVFQKIENVIEGLLTKDPLLQIDKLEFYS
ncbi:hypothetical protein CEXT_651791 [Caerostris extrusa]|uniref:Uncharacterized protein n=1 Tax=Caerostris extrusa TaxID=172846 RepID=A0AAV4X8H8_CAEEX|nr:hypothetical protein CEXT_651791 [Caerostris extrusa]